MIWQIIILIKSKSAHTELDGDGTQEGRSGVSVGRHLHADNVDSL